jgi:hypothetical protein
MNFPGLSTVVIWISLRGLPWIYLSIGISAFLIVPKSNADNILWVKLKPALDLFELPGVVRVFYSPSPWYNLDMHPISDYDPFAQSRRTQARSSFTTRTVFPVIINFVDCNARPKWPHHKLFIHSHVQLVNQSTPIECSWCPLSVPKRTNVRRYATV